MEDEWIERGIKEGLIEIKRDTIKYLLHNKEQDFSDPEEPIRARAYVKLILKYKYLENRVIPEIRPPRREPPLPIDILVYRGDALEEGYITVEAKPSSHKSEIEKAKKEGLGNANLSGSDYLWLVCGDREIAYDVRKHPVSYHVLDKYEIRDIPTRYNPSSINLFYGNGVGNPLKSVPSAKMFKKIMSDCHNVLRDVEHKVLRKAFMIVSRILYMKFWDETSTPTGEYYGFQAGFGEKPKEVAWKIRKLYKRAREREPPIFPQELGINEDLALYKLTKILEGWSISETDLEVKGEAYQDFLDVNFRGPLGQFFTHRNLVNTMVRMVDPGEEDRLIDHACGTGGFLVYALNYVRKKLEQKYKTQRHFERRLLDYTHYYLHGIEVEPDIAQAAISDMIVYEDAHTNIHIDDSLRSWKELEKHGLKSSMFAILLTNPPIGSTEVRRHILDQFELGRGRKGQMDHILFTERGLEFIRPSGLLCTIMSEDVLERMPNVIEYIKKHAYIRAIVSLPRKAFKPYGSNAKTNILLLQKKGGGSVSSNSVFMADIEHIGYDASGEKTEENDLLKIPQMYKDFLNEINRKGRMKEQTLSVEPLVFIADLEKMKKRIDVKHAYLNFLELSKEKLKRKWLHEGYDVDKLKEVASPSNNVIRTSPDKRYLFVSVHFDGTATPRDRKWERQKTKYPALILLEEGDVVLSGIDLIDGAVAVAPSELDGGVASKEFIVLKPKEGLDPEYLRIVLRSGYTQAMVKGLMTGMTGRHRIKWKQLSELEIPIPRKKEKEGFSRKFKVRRNYLEKSRKLLKSVEDKIERIMEF